MTKGTPSFGKKQKKLHTTCPRCGFHSYHISKKVCAKCGYGKSKRIKNYRWKWKKVKGKRKRKK
ncbi:MAG: 50S ribosomal protein L37e [Candidatus Altiarchaeales archaeon]|nr:MAG: 50S ribosomal protein L37e [Candidatus Altiarchaeales archaeon]